MSLIETINCLNTSPRKQEEEYENTSDFLEWFYYHIYREQGFIMYPILYQVTKDSEYESIKNECKNLINMNYSKTLNTDTLIERHNEIKNWLISILRKYGMIHLEDTIKNNVNDYINNNYIKE